MPQWELIIADDGSDENTRAYLESLTRDGRVHRLLRLARSGNPGAARNAGIAGARGTLLAFLDSDDLRVPSKLERQLAALRASPDCGWSYTAFLIVDAEGTPLPSERNRPVDPACRRKSSRRSCARPPPSVPPACSRAPRLCVT